MGVDAEIYFRAKDGFEMIEPLSYEEASAYRKAHQPLATHEIETSQRYYDFGYERGPWPEIAGILMILLASPDVEMVWYHGDHKSEDDPLTKERLLGITDWYLKNGHRPYDDRYFKK